MTHRVGASADVRVPGFQTSGSQMSAPEAIRCAPHVKRAHRAVFSRFALSLHAVIRQRGAASEVSA